MAENLDPDFSTPESLPQTAALVSVPDHELLRLIGKGSYGEVWLAKSTLGAWRAVKIVYESSFRHRRPFDREYSGVQKFEPVSRLHEGLMDVLQVGRNDELGYFYCVMELADDVRTGQQVNPDAYTPRTLAQDVARQKRLPTQECERIGIAVATALEFLHGRGLIHRDVKPSNIVFVNGVPKLADIGLVAEVSEARSYVGTEGFIPPEGPGTVQADIYSFGKVLYEISTGKDRHDYPETPTFTGDSTQEAMLFRFHEVVVKACRADPRQRYKSAAEMAEDLAALGSSEPRTFRRSDRRRLMALAMMGVILTVAFVAGKFLFPAKPGSGAVRSHPAEPGSANPGSTSPTAVRAPAGLVSWWAAEGNAMDHFGANHATAMEGVSFVPGKAGQGFYFNGVGSYLRIPHDTSLNFSNEFSVELWYRDTGTPAYSAHTLIGKQDPYPGPCSLALNLYPGGGTGVSIVFRDPVLRSYQSSSYPQAPPAGVFHHLGATMRQMDSAHVEVKTFIDGQLVQGKIIPGNLANTVNAGPLGIGASLTNKFCFVGVIDEVAIYRRALDDTEMRGIYEAGEAGKCLPPGSSLPCPAGLVGWWMAENSAEDASGRHGGQMLNGASYATGEVGRAFEFNGPSGAINPLVQIPDSPELNPTNALTLEGWICLKELHPQDIPIVAEKGGALESDRQYALGLTEVEGQMRVRGQIWLPVGLISIVGATPILPGTWYHVAMTYNGSVAKLYVNGSQDSLSRPASGPIRVSSHPLWIGGEPSGIWRFHGLVDEFSVYQRALSGAEVLAIASSGNLGKSKFPTPPFLFAHPVSRDADAGEFVQFTVQAGGKVPLHYQWSHDGTDLYGATNSSITLTNVCFEQAGRYAVRVSNELGVTSSSAALLCVHPKPEPVPVPGGLVGWWRADGNADDSVGGAHGRMAGGAAFVPGKVGQAFRLNGIKQCVNIRKTSAHDVGCQMTIEFWMKADSDNSMATFQGLVTSDFYVVGISQGFEIRPMGVELALVTDGGAGGEASATSESIPNTADVNDACAEISTGQWHHIAGTYDGSKLQLYVDGAPWGKPMFHSGSISPMWPKSFVSIGSHDGRTWAESCIGSRYFMGLMDEVSLYNRALSASEISAIYRAGSAGKFLPPGRRP